MEATDKGSGPRVDPTGKSTEQTPDSYAEVKLQVR